MNRRLGSSAAPRLVAGGDQVDRPIHTPAMNDMVERNCSGLDETDRSARGQQVLGRVAAPFLQDLGAKSNE